MECRECHGHEGKGNGPKANELKTDAMSLIQKISGAILVILGILMITGKLTLITAKLGFLNRLVW